MEGKNRLGIIGVGTMGSGHAGNVLEGKCPDFELKAIADRNPDRLEWTKANLPGEYARFDDAIAMLDSGSIDACIVSVPHYEHAKYAMECMKRGIHVMVEKPAGVYTRQVREMNAEADRHPEVVFGMMFNQRTNCIYRKMRELVQSGRYGRIRRANWIITDWYRPQAYYDSGDWRATWSGEGGGVLLNQCPHQLDLWQWICGMPARVQSNMRFGQWHDIEVEDDVTTYMEYENGATGVFVTSTGDAHGTNRFEIQMDGAKLVAEYDRLTLLEYDMPEPEFSKINKTPFATVGAHEVDVAEGIVVVAHAHYPVERVVQDGVYVLLDGVLAAQRPYRALAYLRIHEQAAAHVVALVRIARPYPAVALDTVPQIFLHV